MPAGSSGSTAFLWGLVMHVLVVEDDEKGAAVLVDGLRRSGHEATGVSTGAEALEKHWDADLILLDLGIADIDGFEVCRRIRNARDAPIIAFTERGTEADRVLGLRAGADDCLDKPCGFWELMARIEAVTRRVRGRAGSDGALVVRGPLRIDATTRRVRLGGASIEMTRKEFDLLYRLASEPGVVFSRRRLMAEIWGDPMTHTADTKVSRTIDTHVSVLRRKLGSNRWIRTVHGVGFCFTGN